VGNRNIRKVGAVVLALGLLAVAGCGSASTTSTKAPADIAPNELLTVATGTSASAPAKGSLFVCPRTIDTPFGPLDFPTTFTAASTPWASDGVIDISKIAVVPGSVTVEHEFTISTSDTERRLKGNGLPNHPIGTFPIPADSEAYQYYAALPAEGYANAAEIPVGPYDLDLVIPKDPVVNATPTCLKSLITGVALETGVAWHAEIALDSQLKLYDPNAALPTDECFGHPYLEQYHYHGYSYKCLPNQGNAGEQSPLMGYAVDGFGIYGPLDANGEWITNDQLDECHGMTSMINWDGEMVEMYHYVLNNEFPYSVGCLRGTPGTMSHDMMH
jgi:hypothetical protein